MTTLNMRGIIAFGPDGVIKHEENYNIRTMMMTLNKTRIMTVLLNETHMMQTWFNMFVKMSGSVVLQN